MSTTQNITNKEEQEFLYKGKEKEYNREYQRIYMNRKVMCEICQRKISYAGLNKHKKTSKHKYNELCLKNPNLIVE